MINLHDKHIIVLGAARSGLSAAILLKKHGANVFVSDAAPISEPVKTKLDFEKIPFEEKGHTDRAKSADFVVISPGIPDTAPIVQHFMNHGINIYSELEMASWFNKSPMIAVTGSNGKTTVTSWLAHTWKTAKKSYLTAGNIGNAFSGCVDVTAPEKAVILEVSSFQLDHIDTFRPAISMILNITPDHLDRYQNDFERYRKSKFRIKENQTSVDTFIYNFEDQGIRDQSGDLVQKKPGNPKLLAFSDRQEVPNGIFVRDEQIVFKINQTEEPLMHIGEVGLPGRHNLNNGLATALAARVSEIKNEAIRESLRTFEGVEHRLEPIRNHKGVRYINDSKATNINAVWYALDSFNVPIVLILGGRDKGNNYKELEQQIREKVHTIIGIGEAKAKIKKQIGKITPNYLEALTMKEAVQLAEKQAKRGEVVLLSPACSSFDMFDNYEHRGSVFKQAVGEL